MNCMKKILIILFLLILFILPMDAQNMRQDSMIVRIAEIEVYPDYLDEYLKMSREVGETSV